MNLPPVASRLILVVAIATAASAVGGCASQAKFRKDIVRVATFPDKLNPWLNFDNPPRDIPNGIKIPVYLVASNNPMGVFGDGTLIVDMYVIEKDDSGNEQSKLVRQWEFDTDHAFMYGFKKRLSAGWGYQLRLPWGDADVLGREVMFLVSFKRHDGHVIRAQRTFFKVPKKV